MNGSRKVNQISDIIKNTIRNVFVVIGCFTFLLRICASAELVLSKFSMAIFLIISFFVALYLLCPDTKTIKLWNHRLIELFDKYRDKFEWSIDILNTKDLGWCVVVEHARGSSKEGERVILARSNSFVHALAQAEWLLEDWITEHTPDSLEVPDE